MYLAHLDTTGTGVGNLKRLVIGVSAVPRAMAETFRAKYGVTVLQLSGMTETNPLGVLSTPSPLLMAEGEDFANDLLLTKQGRIRSEEHTSELQSLMLITYAVFCFKKQPPV